MQKPTEKLLKNEKNLDSPHLLRSNYTQSISSRVGAGSSRVGSVFLFRRNLALEKSNEFQNDKD